MTTIALIAHDGTKHHMLRLAEETEPLLRRSRLVATASTGALLAENVGLELERVRSGPLGGDLQIGAMVAEGRIGLVVFLRDPLAAHPHDPDIQALMKVCDVHGVPLATNVASARLCLAALEREAAESRAAAW